MPNPDHPMTIHFPLNAAQDAFNRIDDGNAQPGDEALAAQYQAFCAQKYDQFQDQQRAIEYAEWLAGQCPGCGPDRAEGPGCDTCWEDPAIWTRLGSSRPRW